MYISKKDREIVRNKFNGKCAYTGTILKDDWQVDHIEPCRGYIKQLNTIDNMFPVQKIVNHYKRALSLSSFKNWYLTGLHDRLKKLPKNPKTDKSKRNKAYMLEIAELFGITTDKPFGGLLYFEIIKENK